VLQDEHQYQPYLLHFVLWPAPHADLDSVGVCAAETAYVLNANKLVQYAEVIETLAS